MLQLKHIVWVLTQLSFWKSCSIVVCHLLSTSSNSFTWVLWTRRHPSQWHHLPSGQGLGISCNLKPRWLYPSPGHLMTGFFCSPALSTAEFLVPLLCNCPVNCWSSYLECVILYIVLIFAFLNPPFPPKNIQKILQNSRGEQVLVMSLVMVFISTSLVEEINLNFSLFCLLPKKDHVQ